MSTSQSIANQIDNLYRQFQNAKEISKELVAFIKEKCQSFSLEFEDTNQIVYKNNQIEWIFDKWPNQNWNQALLSNIFYPIELIKCDEMPCTLYELPHIRSKLSLSVYYQHPLA